MNTAPLESLTPRQLVELLWTKRKTWLGAAIASGLLAAAYALVAPRYWQASQALVVRQETAGSHGPTPGKFADLFEMRTMQETILELAKSQQVVIATIQNVDQRLLGSAKAPTAEDVEKFRGRLKMLPPDGGEFGKTEVFYFYLKDPDRDRAIALVSELCLQLDAALKELRATRAAGLIVELKEQVALAAEINAAESQRLAEFESEVGADLGELRMLHSASSGQSDLRQEAVQLEADVRKFEAQVRESEQLLAMLRAAQDDPRQIVATPNSLLVSQPALRRLKDGLVDAQLATARLGGTRSAEHPRVKAALAAETHIRSDLHRELLTAIRGAETELSLGEARVAATRARLDDLQTRLGNLAERRAEYSNRVAAVENSRVTLDRARQNLSTAQAAQAAARSGSLVARVDEPETGPYPAGPGRTAIAGAGTVAGLLLGLAAVFLTAGAPPLAPPPAPLAEAATAAVPTTSTPPMFVERPREQQREPILDATTTSTDAASAVTVEPPPAALAAPLAPLELAPAIEAPVAAEQAPFSVPLTPSPAAEAALPAAPATLPTVVATLPAPPTLAAAPRPSLQEALKAAQAASQS